MCCQTFLFHRGKLATAEGVRTLKSLSDKLNGYFKTGVSCLLQSPTLKSIIEPVICNKSLRLIPSVNVGHVMNDAKLDKCILTEIQGVNFHINGIGDCYTYFQSLSSLSFHSLTEYQALIVQSLFAQVLSETAFQYFNILSNCNRKLYSPDRFICNFLNMAGIIGYVSRFLYLAMHYYRTSRYKEALNVTALVKSRLYQPYLMFYQSRPREIQ